MNTYPQTQNFRHLFGPIASRRLGISLGVNMVNQKTCSLDCVYCECGKTRELTLERKEYVSEKELLQELREYLAPSPAIDYITCAGSGEPTLNTCLGNIVRALKSEFPQYKASLITNGTLFWQKKVRDACLHFDLVLPSLDAISASAFSRVNVPAAGLTVDTMVEGLITFAHEFKGTIWLEVFIVEGVNDTPDELALFKKVIAEINPARVQLNSLDRPGTCAWVKPARRERLEEIAAYLVPANVEIIARQ